MPVQSPKLTKCQKQELQSVISNNDSSSREVKRAQAVIMIDKGKNIDDITELTGLKRSQIFNLRSLYLKEGLGAIEDKKKKQPKKILTKNQQKEIIETVKNKAPNECDDYFTKCEYWTTGVLGEYIKREYNVEYKSKTSYYLLFHQAKFTYHKPGRVYEKHDPQEVKKWRKKTKPKIKKAWKDKNTVILCEDEMILSTQTTFQKMWLPQGEYPRIEVSNTKENRSLYGFLNVKTGQEHAFKTERQNMYITVEILKNIREIYPTQNLLILWDGAGWHRGSKAQEYIKADKNIKTVYFPRYSPEENPQEHVWKSGRSNATHNKFIKDIDEATDEFVNYLNKTEFKYTLLGMKSD